MLLFWRIRYLDSRDREFKNRDLYLVTEELDLVVKTAVEACQALRTHGGGREMLRFRPLFREMKDGVSALQELCNEHGGMDSVFIHDYFEDENGIELTSRRMAEVLTGSQTAIMVPAGARQHDIDYILADKRPIEIDKIKFSPKQLQVLGYFTRDLREMLASAFLMDSPARLSHSGDGPASLQTAVTDEEIRSFVTIFRRLYMQKEPANFERAAAVFSEVLNDHPLARWVTGAVAQYIDDLHQPPRFVPLAGKSLFDKKVRFTKKQLIDAFVYTQYAHQPNKDRLRQFQECLQAVNNNRAILTFCFLTEIFGCGLDIRNTGIHIANVYDRYCEHHQNTLEIVESLAAVHRGIGTLEKKGDREARILQEKAEELAKTFWEHEGRPAGGHQQFVRRARAQLEAAMRGGD